MPKIYSAFCAALISVMAIANHKGLTFTQFLTGAATANKAANHYHK